MRQPGYFDALCRTDGVQARAQAVLTRVDRAKQAIGVTKSAEIPSTLVGCLRPMDLQALRSLLQEVAR